MEIPNNTKNNNSSWLGVSAILFLMLCLASPAAAQQGSFFPTGTMNTGRLFHTVTLLPNGEALVVGGQGRTDVVLPLASAELYDPNTGLFSFTGDMSAARWDHTATVLPNGKVLIAGGSYVNAGNLASAELFSSSTLLLVSSPPLVV